MIKRKFPETIVFMGIFYMLSGKFKLIICNDRSCPNAFVLSGYKDEGGCQEQDVYITNNRHVF